MLLGSCGAPLPERATGREGPCPVDLIRHSDLERVGTNERGVIVWSLDGDSRRGLILHPPQRFGFEDIPVGTDCSPLAMMKNGLEVGYVPIEIQARGGGRSTVRYFRDGAKTLPLTLRVIMLFNPLKFFVPLSLVLFLGGGIYTVVTIVVSTKVSDAGLVLLLAGYGLSRSAS